MWKPTISSDELYHHGILGQKWGKRNGPPYPLSPGAHSPAEKKAGYKKSITKGQVNKTVKEPKHGLIAEIALVLAINAAPFLPIAIAAGVEHHKDKKAEKFRDKCDKEREEATIDKKTGLKKQTTNKTLEENVKRVNPDYRLEGNNGKINCVNCSMTLELRRRGYEVQAQLTSGGKNGFEVAKNCFPKSKNVDVQTYPIVKYDKKTHKPKDPQAVDNWNRYWNKNEKLANGGGNKELAKNAISALKKEPAGSRGQVLVTWNRWSGHSMGYEVTSDGKVRIIDSQVNKIYSEKESERMLRRTCSFSYQRLDNCEFDSKKVKECVR